MSRWLEYPLVTIVFLLSIPIQMLVCLVLLGQLGRPIFFRQRRLGESGKEIIILKMRTMTDGRYDDGRLLPDELRLGRIGRLIRRLRLDELPQLLSILRGDMALVGPRPLLRETLDRFGAVGRRRGMVRPGLTGWSQVSGNTRLSDREKLALDLWYVANRSLALDLRILGETAAVALLGERRVEERVRQAMEQLTDAGGSMPALAEGLS